MAGGSGQVWQKADSKILTPTTSYTASSPSLLSHTHIMAHHDEDHSYHPKDAISAAMKATALTGSVGLFAAAVQNTLTKQNVGTLGVFVRGGGIITTFGMSFFTYKLMDQLLN